MRVALDGRPLASLKTGVGHYTFELARSLASVAPSDHFTLVSPVPLESSVADELKNRSRANLHDVQLNSERLNRYWWSFGLPLYLTRRSFDLFHGTNYDIPRWNILPTVVTIHDLSLLLHPDTHEEPQVKRARRRMPKVAHSAARIITPSESVKREVCEHLGVDPNKVAVTPEAPRSAFRRIASVRTEEVRRRLGVADDFILYVGTIEPRKNLKTLVQAFAEILRTTVHRPQLVIAGQEGWLMDDFFGSIRKNGLEDKVRFTGYLHDEDLCALYSSCSAFVYPSLYEGFGLPPLEAMACGAPVITSDIPVIKETVGSAACLVRPEDGDQIAGAIVRVMEDRRTAEKLSLLGLEQARKFTWGRTASLTLEVYRQVLGPGKS